MRYGLDPLWQQGWRQENKAKEYLKINQAKRYKLTTRQGVSSGDPEHSMIMVNNTVYFKTKRLDLKCSHHKEKDNHVIR